MSKITNDGLTRSGTWRFIVVPIWQHWVSKGYIAYTVDCYCCCCSCQWLRNQSFTVGWTQCRCILDYVETEDSQRTYTYVTHLLYTRLTSVRGSFPAGTPGNGVPKVILTVGTAWTPTLGDLYKNHPVFTRVFENLIFFAPWRSSPQFLYSLRCWAPTLLFKETIRASVWPRSSNFLRIRWKAETSFELWLIDILKLFIRQD